MTSDIDKLKHFYIEAVAVFASHGNNGSSAPNVENNGKYL